MRIVTNQDLHSAIPKDNKEGNELTLLNQPWCQLEYYDCRHPLGCLCGWTSPGGTVVWTGPQTGYCRHNHPTSKRPGASRSRHRYSGPAVGSGCKHVQRNARDLQLKAHGEVKFHEILWRKGRPVIERVFYREISMQILWQNEKEYTSTYLNSCGESYIGPIIIILCNVDHCIWRHTLW